MLRRPGPVSHENCIADIILHVACFCVTRFPHNFRFRIRGMHAHRPMQHHVEGLISRPPKSFPCTPQCLSHQILKQECCESESSRAHQDPQRAHCQLQGLAAFDREVLSTQPQFYLRPLPVYSVVVVARLIQDAETRASSFHRIA